MVIPPRLLLLITATLVELKLIPVNNAPLPVPLQVILPVLDMSPIVFPVTVPIFTEPEVTDIPELTDEVVEVEIEILAIVFPCKLEGVVVPQDIRIPMKLFPLPDCVHAVPPAEAWVPPM